MKKFFFAFFLLNLLLPFCEVTKANEYKFFKTSSNIINGTGTVKFYGVSSDGTESLVKTWESSTSNIVGINSDFEDAIIDQYEGKIYFEVNETISDNSQATTVLEYDLIKNTAQEVNNISTIENFLIYPKGIVKMISEKSDGSIQLGSDVNDIDVVADGLNIDGAAVITKNADGTIQVGNDANDIDLVEDGLNIDGAAVITKKSDGSVQIGTDENDIDITAEGLSIDGDPLITKKANGELHIGKNSWITKEENGRQKVWARDAAGNAIPIDYTNGTKLLINGRDVEQSINNVGALSAALTGLPTVPSDTNLACGLGTGTHGGDFAFSGGCASKVNDKLSINYAASMTMPGQDYAGDFEDQFSARAGFVWKLGKSVKPSLISMKDKQKLTNEITGLKNENKSLNEKITKFETEKLELLARLERLEKVALGESKSKDLATIKIP